MPQGFMQASYKLNATHRFSEPQLKQMKRAYYACITQVDYQLGRLFARLRELDLMENTWLIFTSDHGEMLGDHHMGAKSVYLEGSSHIPLIIRAPSKQIDGFDRSQTPNTETVSQLTTLADLMPTILDITGTPVPADMDGHSLLNLSSKKDPVYYGQTNKSLFAVMKDDLKYMYSVIGGDELCFDLTTDPMEQMNLMKRPEYSDRICELKKLMIGHIKQYAPEIIDDQDNIIKEAPIQSADEIHKWPGFHSITENSDLLH
jgi:arylsulfatase A-like enzyme